MVFPEYLFLYLDDDCEIFHQNFFPCLRWYEIKILFESNFYLILVLRHCIKVGWSHNSKKHLCCIHMIIIQSTKGSLMFIPIKFKLLFILICKWNGPYNNVCIKISYDWSNISSLEMFQHHIRYENFNIPCLYPKNTFGD